jgi:hypothetical protein
MAIARCLHDVSEASLQVVMSGAVGYGVFYFCTNVNPLSGTTLGLVDTVVRNIVQPFFDLLEKKMVEFGPRYAAWCKSAVFYSEIILSLSVCALFLSPSLLTFEVVFYVAVSQIVSLALSHYIFEQVPAY